MKALCIEGPATPTMTPGHALTFARAPAKCWQVHAQAGH